MPKKKTHEEYIAELAIKNPNIEAIDKYLGANTKILHRCLAHNYEWNVCPSGVLNGNGCPKCKSDKIKKKQQKSNEEYIRQLEKTNSNLIPIEEYKGANTRIQHKCLKDGYIWYARPANLLNGTCGCPKCSKRFRRIHSDYVEELQMIMPFIKVLDTFSGMGVAILHKCTKHNIEWKATPYNLLKGHGCPKCGGEKSKIKTTKTHIQYVNDLASKNPDIKVLGTYINSLTPILHKCKIDGYEWNVRPANLLVGKRCPRCTKSEKWTTDKYVKSLKDINSYLRPLENIVNVSTPILHKCEKHNYEWKTSPASTLQGGGCPICGKEKHRETSLKSHKTYIDEVKIKNPNIMVLEQYKGADVPILHKCLIDDYEWKTIPSRILGGCGCPQCNESKGERKIRLWLESHNIEFDKEKSFANCKDIKPLPFDFYIPKINTVIEYDGEQHFRPIDFFGGDKGFEIRQKHDKIKTEYCKNNDMPLLRISYNQNIEEELNNFLFI